MIERQLKIEELIEAGIDCFTITISKKEVLDNDLFKPLQILEQLASNMAFLQYFRERVDIAFDGYNDTTQELWEIPEIRKFVSDLDSQFPYWLYFLSKKRSGLFAIIKCFLLPIIKPEAEKEINGKRLQGYLENRGILAMNHLCELAKISEQENIQMTNRLIEYLTNKWP